MNSRKDSTVGCEKKMVLNWLWRGQYQPQARKEMLAAYMADRAILRLHRRLGGFIKLSWFFCFFGFAGVIVGLVSGFGVPFLVYVSVVVAALSLVSACLLEVWRKIVAPVGESIALTIFNAIEALEMGFNIDVTVMSESEVQKKIVEKLSWFEISQTDAVLNPDIGAQWVAESAWHLSLVAPFYDIDKLLKGA